MQYENNLRKMFYRQKKNKNKKFGFQKNFPKGTSGKRGVVL